ncbi:MAG: hypothetical protein ACRC02_04875 [Vogesella sp.]|uniref:hypothetical protein n=1 Tax=Vogesella sp. TaxID=1904252 RepID=UPI003F319811
MSLSVFDSVMAAWRAYPAPVFCQCTGKAGNETGVKIDNIFYFYGNKSAGAIRLFLHSVTALAEQAWQIAAIKCYLLKQNGDLGSLGQGCAGFVVVQGGMLHGRAMVWHRSDYWSLYPIWSGRHVA